MAKRSTRQTKPRKSRKTQARSRSRPEVFRYEYAQLCMHIARVESTAARNRMDLDIQLRRIAELQDEVDTLRKAMAIES
jgi:hypothetical protein